jgi:hypothetical protein
MSLCEAMRSKAYRSPWANPTSLAGLGLLALWALAGPPPWQLSCQLEAHAAISAAAHCILDGPMLANRQKHMVHAMGPCEAMRSRAYKSPQANSTSSAGLSLLTLRALAGIPPRQPACQLEAHAAISAAAHCVLDGPMLANHQKHTVHAMGPCKAMRSKAYKSPRANSTSSAGLSLLTLRAHASILPWQPACQLEAHAAILAAAHCTLDGPTLANRQKHTVHAMGPCEAMRSKAHRFPWASSTSSAGVSLLRLWAHASIPPWQPACQLKAHAAISAAAHCALDGPTLANHQKHTGACNGPCEAMRSKAYKFLWASSTSSAGLSLLTLWALAEILPR